MRRLTPLTVLLLLGACSYSSTLAIWNRSAEPIDVTYQLRYPLDRGSGYVPAMADRAKGPWHELEPSGYQSSEDRRIITVTIPPGRALRVARPINYFGPSLKELPTFPIIQATIASAGKTETNSAERAILAFEEWNERLYVYVHDT